MFKTKWKRGKGNQSGTQRVPAYPQWLGWTKWCNMCHYDLILLYLVQRALTGRGKLVFPGKLGCGLRICKPHSKWQSPPFTAACKMKLLVILRPCKVTASILHRLQSGTIARPGCRMEKENRRKFTYWKVHLLNKQHRPYTMQGPEPDVRHL